MNGSLWRVWKGFLDGGMFMTRDLVTRSTCREMLEHGGCRRSLQVTGGQTRIERMRRSEKENFWRRRESSGKTTAGNCIVSILAM